jgi:hypothetical protein
MISVYRIFELKARVLGDYGRKVHLATATMAIPSNTERKRFLVFQAINAVGIEAQRNMLLEARLTWC